VPPVSIDHIDVSALMQEMVRLRAEAREVVNLRAELAKFREWCLKIRELLAIQLANVSGTSV
jgi:hypothetical protein